MRALGSRGRRGAFTLAEVLVAIAILGVVIPGTVGGLLHVNRRATLSRAYTAAHVLAGTRMELLRGAVPFNPQLGQIPADLAVGTRTESNIPIYVDPEDDSVLVSGTLQTTVADVGLTQGTTNLNVRRLTVSVLFTSQGRDHAVTLTTLRTSDQ